MNIPQLELTLKAVTAEHCVHEERKGVLGMSNLYLPIDEILQRYKFGYHPDNEQKLKLFQGTQSEIAMRGRLMIVCKNLGLQWEEPEVLFAYEGRLTGHTDGSVNDHVLEIKTVPNAEILNDIKKSGRVPYKVFCQVNSYMLWGMKKKALVIYETRNEGQLCLVEVLPSEKLQAELKAKAEKVLSLVGAYCDTPLQVQPANCIP